MAVCLSSLMFIEFLVRFHWPMSCQSNLSLDAMERSSSRHLASKLHIGMSRDFTTAYLICLNDETATNMDFDLG